MYTHIYLHTHIDRNCYKYCTRSWTKYSSSMTIPYYTNHQAVISLLTLNQGNCIFTKRKGIFYASYTQNSHRKRTAAWSQDNAQYKFTHMATRQLNMMEKGASPEVQQWNNWHKRKVLKRRSLLTHIRRFQDCREKLHHGGISRKDPFPLSVSP